MNSALVDTLLGLIVVVATMAGVGCSAPASTAGPLAETPHAVAAIAIAADFRPDHQHAAVRAPLAISDAALLARLFPSRLADETQCPPRAQDTSLESQRSLGLVVPKVAAVVAGSFTAPHRHEVAIIVRVGECHAYGAESGGSKELVVLDGARIVWTSKVASEGDEVWEDDLETLADLDGDGVDELVLELNVMHMGHAREAARVVSLAGGSLRELFPSTEVMVDDCPTDEPGATTRSAWIEVTRGKTPSFIVRWTNTEVCPRD
jgi:hypothetical protein